MNDGVVVWLTGLPASGKTTIARELVASLRARGCAVLWLDSDDLRAVLTPEASYAPEERDRFYAAIGHVAALAAEGGVTVVVSATAPKRAYRDRVRERVRRVIEVLVIAPREVLIERDPKGLYARAARGEVTTLPGAGATYEPPLAPELELDTTKLDAAGAAASILAVL